jgi:UDP-N-acetylmuramyl pentapeptide phosphotransferase/UDP-N-acetylglucosamine-1-phosphate transferase
MYMHVMAYAKFFQSINMSILADVLMLGVCGCISSGLINAFLIKKASCVGLLDKPNERSLHTQVTPRGGGIGIVVALLLGTMAWRSAHGHYASDCSNMCLLLFSVALVAGVSLWDDFRSVSVGVRFGVHAIAAIIAIISFGAIYRFEAGALIQLGRGGVFLTLLWVVGLTNVFNFMDGIDGIAGLQALIAATAWCLLGVFVYVPLVSVIGALLGGGCAGFLIYNWNPARIFMGDVGSAFLGFCFGVLPLFALRELPLDTNPIVIARMPVFAVLVVWPFIADGSFTFCRRLLKREPVWRPHRSHLYQRMVQAGWNHGIVASYYGLWAVLCSVTGIYFILGGEAYCVWAAAALFAVVTWTLTVVLEHRKGARG